jgi:O-antigen ligase
MSHTILFLTCGSFLLAGLLGITLSIPLHAVATIVMGIGALCAVIFVLKNHKLCSTSIQCRGINFWLIILLPSSIAYFIARACFSPVWDLAIEDLMLILPAATLCLVTGYTVGGKQGIAMRQGLALMVIILLMFHLAACLIQLNGGEGYSIALDLEGSLRATPHKITGMYGYYGSFANFSVIAGCLCISLGLWGRINPTKKCAIFLLGLVALCFAFVSQSRSAALSIFSSLAVLIILGVTASQQLMPESYKRFRLVNSIAGILMLVCGLLGSLWVMEQRGVKSFGMLLDSSIRIPFWAMAGDIWNDHRWIGAGSRSFSYECNNYWSASLGSGERNPEFVHNEYLQLLTDYGLIGLVLALGILSLFLLIGYHRVRAISMTVKSSAYPEGSNALALTVAGMSGMVAMLTHVCFDFPTHLQANLLLLVCCSVWVLPLPTFLEKPQSGEVNRVAGTRSPHFILSLFLGILSLSCIGIGGQQLWAALPLIEKKIAKEDGEWKVEWVDRDLWIPVLEKSLARTPNWKRYQRLGGLYYDQALEVKNNEQKAALLFKASECYQASIKRHPHNIIAKMNLASVYDQQNLWRESDMMYADTSNMTYAREHRFRMHQKWGDMHMRWATALIGRKDYGNVEVHFQNAKKLYNDSKYYAPFHELKKWSVPYTRILISYADYLDFEGRYAESEKLYQQVKLESDWSNNQAYTNLGLHYAQHLYAHGKHLWGQRNPEEAYKLILDARSVLLQYQKSTKLADDDLVIKKMKTINAMISFFEKTGIGKNSNATRNNN